jgi:hypothetical protein
VSAGRPSSVPVTGRAAGLRDADRAVGLRPSDRWSFWPGCADLAWAVFALVRAVARGHGGEVRVRSVPGSGSKFEIVLPALAPPDDGPADVLAPTQAGDPCGNVNLR